MNDPESLFDSRKKNSLALGLNRKLFFSGPALAQKLALSLCLSVSFAAKGRLPYLFSQPCQLAFPAFFLPFLPPASCLKGRIPYSLPAHCQQRFAKIFSMMSEPMAARLSKKGRRGTPLEAVVNN